VDGSPPPAPPRDGLGRSRALALFAIAFALYAAFAVATVDYLTERDSEARLLHARDAANGDVDALLDPWNKPVMTGLCALVLLAGGGVVALKVLQAALAAATLVACACAAAWAGARPRAAVAAATIAGLAPFFVREVVSVLTETSCALFLALAILAWVRERVVLSALAVSASFLARFDGVLFALAWLPFVARRGPGRTTWARRVAAVLALGAAPLLWHLAGWATTGDAKFLFARQPHPWTGSSYGHGSFFAIAALLPVTAGTVLLPAALGLRRAPGPAVAAAGVALVAHSAMWGFGLLGSAGLPRYLVTIVPSLAVAAAFGLPRLPRAVALCTFVLAIAGAAAAVAYREPSWEGEVELAREAPGGFTEDPVVMRLSRGGRRFSRLAEARPGDRVAWESVWATDAAPSSLPLDRLVLVRTIARPARWGFETSWEGRVYHVR
jgi:hypothetical protein